VDYFNKMAELVLFMAFNTYMCRKRLTKRQKFQKPNDFRQANETLCWKKYNVFARWSPVLSYATL